jgi:hypothetical protein
VIKINTELRVSLSVAFFAGIVVSLLFADKLGKVTAICFSLGAFCLFCGIVIMPILLDRKTTMLNHENYPISPLVPGVQEKHAEAFRYYDVRARLLIGIGLTLFVLGIVAFAVAY